MQETSSSPTLADLLGVLHQNKRSDLPVQSGEVPISRINVELGRFEMPALAGDDVLRKTIAAANEALVFVPAALIDHINATEACHMARHAAQANLNDRLREEEQARSKHSRQFARF